MKKKIMMNNNPMIKMAKDSLISLPTPTSISLMWNMGFLLGMCLILQIITGVILSMNYVAHTSLAFSSIIHIMRDVEGGWMMRYLHMNGASLFFMLMYTHMGRGIYFNSPSKLPMVWISGVVIFVWTMMSAFMGYVLPWGQMSFWGATVITNMLSAIPYIGSTIMQWLWGDFSISQPTLNRFLSLHFLAPLILVVIVMAHMILLHETGSSNPMGLSTDYDKVKFFPYFAVKDTMTLIMVGLMMVTLISMSPNMLGDVENFTKASPSSTPSHIQPEWYFLFAYAILRSIPSKLGGVVMMMMSIVILLVLCLKKSQMNSKFSPQKKATFWAFVVIVLLLTWIGANPVEDPFTSVGMIITTLYFAIVFSL